MGKFIMNNHLHTRDTNNLRDFVHFLTLIKFEMLYSLDVSNPGGWIRIRKCKTLKTGKIFNYLKFRPKHSRQKNSSIRNRRGLDVTMLWNEFGESDFQLIYPVIAIISFSIMFTFLSSLTDFLHLPA